MRNIPFILAPEFIFDGINGEMNENRVHLSMHFTVI
jgi:hypothetical protein